MKPWFIFCLPIWSLAVEVSFDVGPRQIGINQTLELTIRVEDGSRGTSTPSFPDGLDPGDFQLQSSRPSTSFQTTIVNNAVSSVQSFTYRLRPKRKGTLNFPAQTVRIGGQTYRSEPVTIEVGDEVRAVSPRGNDPFGLDDLFGRRRGRQPSEVFVEIETPKTDFYLGEAIPLTTKIYLTPGVRISSQGSSMDLPDFQDFWVEEIERPGNERIERRNGKQYQVMIVDQRRLFANKTGKLVIPPVQFSLLVAPPFSFLSDYRRAERQTEPITLTIKPLPTEGRPPDFNGIVGQFKTEGSLDKDKVKVGESVSLQVNVSGRGNFSAIQDLKPQLDQAFEVFPGGTPETEKRGGVITSKTWVYALVPKREGTFKISLPRFSFFDVRTQSYRTTSAREFTLEVLPGQGLGQPLPPLGGQERLVAEQNLNFIKLDDLERLDAEPKLYQPRRLVHVLAGFLGADLLVFVGFLWWNRQMSRKQRFRPRFAFRNFKKAAAKLRGLSGDADLFYAGLSEAILSYFGDKWERPGQGISLELIRDRFHRLELDERHYQQVEECIEACDLARFTPSTPSSRESLLAKTTATIGQIEEALP